MKRAPEISIITVSSQYAQETARRLVKAGMIVPASVKLRNVDLSTELINLTHFLSTIN